MNEGLSGLAIVGAFAPQRKRFGSLPWGGLAAAGQRPRVVELRGRPKVWRRRRERAPATNVYGGWSLSAKKWQRSCPLLAQQRAHSAPR